MSDDTFGWILVGIVGFFALAMSGRTSWALGGTVVIGVLVGAAVLIPLIMAASGRGRTTTRTVHIDAGDWADAARHEAGHLAAMQRYGGRNLRGRIYADGSGWASADMPPNAPVSHNLAVDYAGGYAEGSWHACRADLAQARGELSSVGWTRRGKEEARGRRLARAAVGGGATHRYKTALERTGRYR